MPCTDHVMFPKVCVILASVHVMRAWSAVKLTVTRFIWNWSAVKLPVKSFNWTKSAVKSMVNSLYLAMVGALSQVYKTKNQYYSSHNQSQQEGGCEILFWPL